LKKLLGSITTSDKADRANIDQYRRQLLKVFEIDAYLCILMTSIDASALCETAVHLVYFATNFIINAVMNCQMLQNIISYNLAYQTISMALVFYSHFI